MRHSTHRRRLPRRKTWRCRAMMSWTNEHGRYSPGSKAYRASSSPRYLWTTTFVVTLQMTQSTFPRHPQTIISSEMIHASGAVMSFACIMRRLVSCGPATGVRFRSHPRHPRHGTRALVILVRPLSTDIVECVRTTSRAASQPEVNVCRQVW
ncbi:hypothetical protein BKA62DRAFT_507285 [Auriculariales sp. MPI-PUGE-AT-0066]|nr:hypothetical protein BKA62DRAFT_507285 [Auriculariales sp. MPI-PUGE-AT-0066]